MGRLLRAAQRSVPQGQPRRARTSSAGNTTATCTTTSAASKAVDESVGRVLEYLDDEGLAENTIVVYSSDQGFYLGEHGWFDKRWIYEESLRTPLAGALAGRDQAGQREQRHRLEPRLRRDVPRRRRPADPRGDAGPQPGAAARRARRRPTGGRASTTTTTSTPAPHHVRPHYGVVTDRYKLVHFYAPDVDYWELFDLKKDPHELRSVYGHPEYADTQKRLETELKRLRTELKVPEKNPPSWYGNKPLDGAE